MVHKQETNEQEGTTQSLTSTDSPVTPKYAYAISILEKRDQKYLTRIQELSQDTCSKNCPSDLSLTYPLLIVINLS